ncbi:MAG: hypothetical protein H7Y88_12050 [Phycisphaerales bacterium]|nr:hypothetical protein [Phycisphaerales bacterium]
MTAETTAEPPPRSSNAALDIHQKALAVNLDTTSFGSFAEIGAGQEVARWFLRVGGASGTVAKTISAYDKEVSDDLYGSGTRYVSKPRLEAMLEREWKSLVQQVGDARGKETRLFAFADTIAARNFTGTNDCHGWIGVRFQDRPGAEASEVLLHVNLRDTANLRQQEAVGVLGVNMLHALLHERTASEDIPSRMFENLSNDRVEIDQIEIRGAAFAGRGTRGLHAALARDGRAEAVLLTADGSAVPANEFFYKKAVVIAPAASDPRDDLSRDAIAACVQALRREVAADSEVKDVVNARLVVLDDDPSPPDIGNDAVMMARHRPLFLASEYVRRYTRAPLRFAIPIPTLIRIFDDARYQHLEGRLLEGIARLFGSDVRVLAYPCRRQELQDWLSADPARGWVVGGSLPWITAEQLRPAPPLRHLYEYMLASGFLVAMPAA